MSQPDNERILEKVRRLLMLSQSSNPHEAAAAAAKAQELLTRYNLEIPGVPEAQREDYGREMYDIGNNAAWRASLLHVVAKHHYCQAVSHGAGKVGIVGQRHNIEIATYLYEYLAREIDRLADVGWRDYTGWAASSRVWKNDFRTGAVVAINQALDQQERTQEAAPDTMALIVRNDRALAEATRRVYPHLRHTSRKARAGDGYYAGHRAGQGIGINPGVRQGAASSGLLR